MTDTTDAERRWNHNIHHHPVLLDAVPPGARDALDVGCGEGTLTRRLAATVPRVVGIDLDGPSIDAARAAAGTASVRYVLDDFLTHPFPPSSFDVVVSVATLHHVDARRGLSRLVELLRPGGTLGIVGCARSSRITELPWELGGIVTHQVLRRRRRYWEHPSPTLWPPPVTYAQMRALAHEVLPGARFRRRLLWRYSIVWRKPDDRRKPDDQRKPDQRTPR